LVAAVATVPAVVTVIFCAVRALKEEIEIISDTISVITIAVRLEACQEISSKGITLRAIVINIEWWCFTPGSIV
jgi:hypothetical protein